MFGSWLDDLYAPTVQCSKCNKKLVLKGDYIPKEVYCSNCGNEIHLVFNEDCKFPNIKYDEDGKIIREEEIKEKNE